MSNCPYFDNCFRRSYTQFLQDNNDQYPDYLVDRNELFFQGYSSQDMMNARRSKKGKLIYKGLYCQTLPDPVKPHTYCPDLSDRDYQECHEYRTEFARLEKFGKKRERSQKYLNRTKRLPIPKPIRDQVAARDKFNCYYCCRNYQVLRTLDIKIQIDHIIPLAIGGSNEASNLAFTCQQCNRDKNTEIWQRGCRKDYY